MNSETLIAAFLTMPGSAYAATQSVEFSPITLLAVAAAVVVVVLNRVRARGSI